MNLFDMLSFGSTMQGQFGASDSWEDYMDKAFLRN